MPTTRSTTNSNPKSVLPAKRVADEVASGNHRSDSNKSLSRSKSRTGLKSSSKSLKRKNRMRDQNARSSKEERKRHKTWKEISYLQEQFLKDPEWTTQTVLRCKNTLNLRTDQIYKWGYDKKKAIEKERLSCKLDKGCAQLLDEYPTLRLYRNPVDLNVVVDEILRSTPLHSICHNIRKKISDESYKNVHENEDISINHNSSQLERHPYLKLAFCDENMMPTDAYFDHKDDVLSISKLSQT